MLTLQTKKDNRVFISATPSSRSKKLTPEELARKWQIGVETAKRSLKATTHEALRTTNELHRRFRTDSAHRRFKSLSTLHGECYCNTIKMSVKSVRGYVCGNIFTNRAIFIMFLPMMNESSAESAMTLNYFVHAVGIPKSIN